MSKNNCDQCEYHGTHRDNVKRLKLTVHEGVKYSCDQCEFQGTHQRSVKAHKLAVHKGAKYNFDQYMWVPQISYILQESVKTQKLEPWKDEKSC